MTTLPATEDRLYCVGTLRFVYCGSGILAYFITLMLVGSTPMVQAGLWLPTGRTHIQKKNNEFLLSMIKIIPLDIHSARSWRKSSGDVRGGKDSTMS